VGVLFLDPTLLVLLLVVAGYSGVVWSGRFSGWLGRPGAWTAVAWPLPALLLLGPIVGAAALGLARLAGLEPGRGGVGGATAYAAAYLVPTVGLAVWPPRWLLPGWARARIVGLPPVDADAPVGAMAAVHGRRGHGSRAWWVWQVDAVAGMVWLEGGTLHFRAAADGSPDALAAAMDLDDEAIGQLRLGGDGELRLEPPRGGWWSRTRVEVHLSEIDRCRVRRRAPWRDGGRLTVEVAGRRSLQLTVADARTLLRWLTTARTDGPTRDRGPW
jgi:hypothetical protein